MIFNTEAEIEAYYEGRIVEDRWAWWKDGSKWCGVSDVRALQDIVSELRTQKECVIAAFKNQSVKPDVVVEHSDNYIRCNNVVLCLRGQ